MGEDHAIEHSFGHITSGVSQGELARGTIQYVRDQLPEWRDDPDRPDEEPEDKLNAQLCKFLDSHARSDFPMVRFDHEEPQVSRRQADLSASPVEPTLLEARLYTIYDPVLIMECKRLPAPSRDREREYVTGGEKRNGGIQRFKLGLYAAKHDLAGLVGYVQQRTARHWYKEINKWISDLATHTQEDGCVWCEGESLEPLEEDLSKGIASCRSSHDRTGDTRSHKIELHHLWITMFWTEAEKSLETK